MRKSVWLVLMVLLCLIPVQAQRPKLQLDHLQLSWRPPSRMHLPPLLPQFQVTPNGYVNPIAFVGLGVDGLWHYTKIDLSGNLSVTGGASLLLGGPSGYVNPIAPVGLDPNGNWQYLNIDASGNLKTTGSGGGTVPTGTGFPHITSGSQDAAARAVNIASADVSGTLGVGNGGTGVANPLAHSVPINEGSSAYSNLPSPTTNGNCYFYFPVVASTAVDPTCAVSGVTVNSQVGTTYNLTPPADRMAYIPFSTQATATLTLCQITGTCAGNFSFATENQNSGNLTIAPNAADIICLETGCLSQGTSFNLPSQYWAVIYQDNSSAPGHWYVLKGPDAAAFTAASTLTVTSRVSGSNYTQTTATITLITGLSWPVAANEKAAWSCDLTLIQATAGTVLNFYMDDVTNVPLSSTGMGTAFTNNGSSTFTLTSLAFPNAATTGSKNIASFTPAAANVNQNVHLSGSYEQGSGTSTFQIELSVTGGANQVTIDRGSFCTKTSGAN